MAANPKLIVALDIPLACGCTFNVRNATTLGMTEPSPHPDVVFNAINHGAGSLVYWYKNRLPRHRCDLVSPDNPNGIAPKDQP